METFQEKIEQAVENAAGPGKIYESREVLEDILARMSRLIATELSTTPHRLQRKSLSLDQAKAEDGPGYNPTEALALAVALRLPAGEALAFVRKSVEDRRLRRVTMREDASYPLIAYSRMVEDVLSSALLSYEQEKEKKDQPEEDMAEAFKMESSKPAPKKPDQKKAVTKIASPRKKPAPKEIVANNASEAPERIVPVSAPVQRPPVSPVPGPRLVTARPAQEMLPSRPAPLASAGTARAGEWRYEMQAPLWLVINQMQHLLENYQQERGMGERTTLSWQQMRLNWPSVTPFMEALDMIRQGRLDDFNNRLEEFRALMPATEVSNGTLHSASGMSRG